MGYSVKIFFTAVTLYLASEMTAFEPSRSITHKIYSITPEKSKFSMESFVQTHQVLDMSERVKGL